MSQCYVHAKFYLFIYYILDGKLFIDQGLSNPVGDEFGGLNAILVWNVFLIGKSGN